jgi:branched-chain amino acid transport system permease protein
MFYGLIIVWAAVLVVPWFLSGLWVTSYFEFGILGAVAVSFLIIGGLGGELSIAQGTFFGIGGYTSATLLSKFGISPWIGAICGAALSASLAGLLGFVVFALGFRRLYFAVATLGFAEAAAVVATHLPFTNGGAGILLSKPPSVANMIFMTPAVYGALAVGWLGVSVLAAIVLGRSSIGLKLRMARSDETLAKSEGIRVVPVKIAAFALSAPIASVAGTLYAQFNLSITPTTMFDLSRDFKIILAVLIGGIAVVIGPAIGAIVAVAATQLVALYVPDLGGIGLVVYGILILIVTTLLPDGVAGNAQGFRRVWQSPLAQLQRYKPLSQRAMSARGSASYPLIVGGTKENHNSGEEARDAET